MKTPKLATREEKSLHYFYNLSGSAEIATNGNIHGKGNTQKKVHVDELPKNIGAMHNALVK